MLKLIATWGYNVSSTKEKQATPKAAFVFLVRIASGRPAKQAKKRGARVRERDKERKSDAEGGICFSRADSERTACEAGRSAGASPRALMNEDSAAFGAADRKEQAVMTTWVQFWQTFQEVFRYTWAHMVWINLVLAIIIIFFQRKEAKSAWAWLLALNVLPGLGFLMYLLAGTDMHKRKMFKIKGIEEQINDAVRRQEYSVKSRELEQENPDLKDFSDLVFFNLESAGCMISGDNAVEIFTDGNDKFDALIEDIKNAESYIFLQYYIIKDDVLFQRIREALLEKSGTGCRNSDLV